MNKMMAQAEPRPSTVSPFRGFFPRSMFNDLIDHYFNDNQFEMAEVMNATMDVAETEHAFEVQMDLPGVQIDDVDIQIDNNTLTVRGQRLEKSETDDENKKFHRIDRGAFLGPYYCPRRLMKTNP